jgi:hypothetical protein
VTLAYAELLELAWVTPLAVLVVCGSYSLLLLGATRSSERRRDGRAGSSTAYGLLATLSALVFAGTVLAGIWVIVDG